MSPLQFQKTLRLREARRLMLSKMRGAEVGAGNTVGGSTLGAPLGSWSYAYGKADELVSSTETSGGVQRYASGAEGRIITQTGPDGGEAFAYDGEGRQIPNGCAAYPEDTRGWLVNSGPASGESAGVEAGSELGGVG